MFHPSEDWLPALPKQNEEAHVDSANFKIKISRINESFVLDQNDQECMTIF